MQFLCCWRLRNQHELDAVIEVEPAPQGQITSYHQATRDPYSFLFVYYLKSKNESSSSDSKSVNVRTSRAAPPCPCAPPCRRPCELRSCAERASLQSASFTLLCTARFFAEHASLQSTLDSSRPRVQGPRQRRQVPAQQGPYQPGAPSERRRTRFNLRAAGAGQRQRGGPADETQTGGCKAAGRLPGASEAQDPH